MPQMRVHQRLYARAGSSCEPESRRRLMVQLAYDGAEGSFEQGVFAREIMHDQRRRDICMARNLIEREFNYSIFSQNSNCRSNDMLATISFNLRHELAYQTLNAYSTPAVRQAGFWLRYALFGAH